MRFILILLLMISSVNAAEYPLKNPVLPKTKDDFLGKVFNDKSTIFYKLPKVYQKYTPSSEVVHSNLTLGTMSKTLIPEDYGIYSVTYKPELNANLDFPWDTTMGLSGLDANLYTTTNLILLPNNKPIVVVKEYPYTWVYPEGTIVGEILYTFDKEKKQHLPFEVRLRQKLDNTWQPRIFRPLKNREEFIKFTRLPPNEPGKRYAFFRNSEEDQVEKLEGTVEKIEDLTPNWVRYILAEPFQEVTGEGWNPAASQDFHIVPKNYSLGLVDIDEQSCSRCHKQTQISVRALIPKEPIIMANLLDVGNIRGSDGVFTWHPFDESSFRKAGEKQPTVRLRAYDYKNNIVEVYDPEKHAEYKLTKYVQESLTQFELPKKYTQVLNKEAEPNKIKVLETE